MIDEKLKEAQDQIEDVDRRIIGNKRVREKSSGLAGGYSQVLTQFSAAEIASQIVTSHALIRHIVSDRDIPMLLNDTIFHKIVKDCKNYYMEAIRDAQKYAE